MAEPSVLDTQADENLVMLADRRFLLSTGAVDLLAMPRNSSPEAYRAYIESSRRIRLFRRQTKSA